jgi:hypothetical protein
LGCISRFRHVSHKPYSTFPLTSPFLGPTPPMSIFEFLVASVTLTFPPQPPHKLAPHSTPCVFLGYSPHRKGYLCLDRQTNRIIMLCHVVFEESSFPFEDPTRPTRAALRLIFLDDCSNPVSVPAIICCPCRFFWHHHCAATCTRHSGHTLWPSGSSAARPG